MFDPSELRTDVTGKVVRYLHENGAMVEAGQPYVEVEAMKMIVPIKSTESGKITNNLSPGSVINAGDLLATLELKDSSKTHKIENFEGSLGYKTFLDTDPKKLATYLLAGFKHDPEEVAQTLLAGAHDLDSAADIVSNAVNEFLKVEGAFDGLL